MARIKDKLKVKRINSIKEPGKYSDGGGLYLQMSKSITKSWLFIYKRDGKKHELGLGSLDARSLAKARDEATKYRELLADGIDPLTEKRKGKQDGELTKALTRTFKQCAEVYKAQRCCSANPHSYKGCNIAPKDFVHAYAKGMSIKANTAPALS